MHFTYVRRQCFPLFFISLLIYYEIITQTSCKIFCWRKKLFLSFFIFLSSPFVLSPFHKMHCTAVLLKLFYSLTKTQWKKLWKRNGSHNINLINALCFPYLERGRNLGEGEVKEWKNNNNNRQDLCTISKWVYESNFFRLKTLKTYHYYVRIMAKLVA